MFLFSGGDEALEVGDLVGGGAGVVLARFEDGGEGGFVEGEAVVSTEAGDEVVFHHFAGAEVVDGGDGVLLDNLVSGLAADSGFDGFHHEGGGHEEGEVACVLGSDDGFVGINLTEDGEKGFEEAIGGEEGVGEHDASDDGAGDVAFIPLVAGEASGHREVAFEDGMEAVDALAGAGVHLVRHGTGAGLAGGESFRGGFVAGHEAEGFAEGTGCAAEIRKGADGGEVEATRVDLTNVDEEVGDAEVADDALFEVGYFGGVAIEQ